MPKTIKELAQEMTKEEFLKHVDDEGECPHKYGLDGSIDKKDCNGGFDIEECHNCWNKATKDIKFRDNSTALFQTAALPILTKLADSETAYKKLSEQRDKLKTELLEAMDKYNINKWENEKFSVTYVKGSTTTTIDSKKIKELHPDIFQECSRISNRKASIRFNVK